jgi:hypothetical protein
MNLLGLPPEILHEILRNLEDPRSLVAARQVRPDSQNHIILLTHMERHVMYYMLTVTIAISGIVLSWN